MRIVQPNTVGILALDKVRRDEIVKLINDDAIYQVVGGAMGAWANKLDAQACIGKPWAGT